jgi:predicted ATP-grasp superfamily ATP-dependent carboligase
MDKKYYAVANTSEYGLTKGKEYIIETSGIGSVYVYGINGDYLTHCRKDSFDNWKLIKVEK